MSDFVIQLSYPFPFLYKECKEYACVPLFWDDQGLGLGVIKRPNKHVIDWAKRICSSVTWVVLSKKDYALVTDQYFGKRNSLEQLLEEAALSQASDIHFFAEKETCQIFFRVNQDIIKQKRLPLEQARTLIELIKFESHIDYAHSQMPQQGSFYLDSYQLSIRVSILPSLHGQDLVLRLFHKANRFSSVCDLGINSKKVNMIHNMIYLNSGLILVSGPTGSGKTTTLYAIAQEILTKRKLVVVSLEDPIECDIPGVRQSQVSIDGPYTYSVGLKAVLRQDPDVIIVGEIRDAQTAAIACQAAYTGHLVLSSCHTPNIWETLMRLKQLALDMHQIQGALKGIIAQRLRPSVNTSQLDIQCCLCSKGLTHKAFDNWKQFRNEIDFLDWDFDKI